MVEQFADRHPEALILAFGLAVVLVIAAVVMFLDAFGGQGECDEAAAPALPPVPRDASLPPVTGAANDAASLMAAHRAVVRRHAEMSADPYDRVIADLTARKASGQEWTWRPPQSRADALKNAYEHALEHVVYLRRQLRDAGAVKTWRDVQ